MNPNFRQPAQQIVYHIRKGIVYILHYYFSFYSPYWLNLYLGLVMPNFFYKIKHQAMTNTCHPIKLDPPNLKNFEFRPD